MRGGAGFISNFVLWSESGYFDNEALTKPLQHLWSLGIEEQFYIAWPLLLWITWKRRLNLLGVAIAVGGISFVLNIWKIQSDAVATFYSPQTRFWELLTGSVLAYIALYKNNFLFEIKHKYGARLISVDNAHSNEAVGKIFRNILLLLGAILIGAGIIFTSKERAFPGWWALFPHIGCDFDYLRWWPS